MSEADHDYHPLTDERLEEIRWHWYGAGNVVPAVYDLLAEVDYQRAENGRLRGQNSVLYKDCEQLQAEVEELQERLNGEGGR